MKYEVTYAPTARFEDRKVTNAPTLEAALTIVKGMPFYRILDARGPVASKGWCLTRHRVCHCDVCAEGL